MIFSKSTYNRITTLLLIPACLLFTVLLIIGITEYRQSRAEMKRDMLFLFKQAISEEVKLKMENEYSSLHVENPSRIKERVRNQTLITEDTVITWMAEVNDDIAQELQKISQTYLLYINRIHPDTLQQIFNLKLEEKGFKARSVILVRHQDKIEMSGDTTGYTVNYRIPVVKGGSLDEISYEGVIHYSPLAVFRLMPKSLLTVLIILEVLMMVAIIYLYLEKNRIKPDKIIKKWGYYYIGETIFNTRKKVLISPKGKEMTVSNQQADILLMFLESDDYTLIKDEIQNRFWKGNSSAYGSMTSAVNKLRHFLKETDCSFHVYTKKGVGYYILKYMTDDTKMNERVQVTHL